ncbi:MAG: hypothetical protein GKR88_15450 [Flavobacteriaceae bacterium]|nr:MAG: hypothetical protein GKR88_15450 [Flavobacteriaceae bacterium]
MIQNFLKNNSELSPKEIEDLTVQLLNQGYNFGKSIPMELQEKLEFKIYKLSKESPNKGRWQVLKKGFDLAMFERLRNRKQEIEKVKITRRLPPSLGRSKN